MAVTAEIALGQSNQTYCRPAQLAIIVPTYREADNVAELARQVASALPGVDWELIFVDDDSPDGTAERIRQLARTDGRIRVLQRIGRRGLSSACIEGLLASAAPCLAVMDGDLQHDATLLPEMLAALEADPALDIVVGSRHVTGGGIGKWNATRKRMSRLANWIGRRFIHAELQDPMSGFFMLRAEALHQRVRGLSAIGYKILLDLFLAHPIPLRFRELPYTFTQRQIGESKLEQAVLWEYLLMLLQKIVGRTIPVRFIAFSLIGGLGVFVHMAALTLLLHMLGNGAFLPSQAIAALLAMTSNFFLNNMLTYRDMRLRGRQLLWGWMSFVTACGIGAVANVGIANYLFASGQSGWALAALAGILVGAVWNYAITAVYTWRQPAKAK